jgi:hypothetical protein
MPFILGGIWMRHILPAYARARALCSAFELGPRLLDTGPECRRLPAPSGSPPPLTSSSPVRPHDSLLDEDVSAALVGTISVRVVGRFSL